MPSPPLPEPRRPGRLENRSLLLLLLAVSLAFGWILLPFHGAIMWGAIIALLFAPWYRWLSRWFKGRSTLAALLTLLAALLIVVLPLGLLITSVVREASQVYELIQSGAWKPSRYLNQVYMTLPDWVVAWLKRFGLADLYQLRGRVGRWNRPAYAYLLTPQNRVLPELSQKRLRALNLSAIEARWGK